MRIKTTVILLIIISAAITIYFFASVVVDGFWIWNDGPIEFAETGQVGDFIGGIVGTIFSGAGLYFLYLTLNEQRIAVSNERFESKFFDLIKLHRDNVSELEYSQFGESGKETANGRKVFRLIFNEFLECLKEVRNYAATKNADDYIRPKYSEKLKKILMQVSPKIDLYQIITIDIAFCIVYYGLGEEGEVVLKRLFAKKYADPFYHRLINYLQMKPKRSKKRFEEFEKWRKFKSLSLERRMEISNELYDKRRGDASQSYTSDAIYYRTTRIGVKYYGGHQFRLGHYFRHLFQSYKYLNNHPDLSTKEKYFYGKILRAQLSTYEQALLFIDSLSSLGFKWDILPEYESRENLSDEQFKLHIKEHRLITKFNLIKNLPGNRILDIKYKDYYPDVQFESDDMDLMTRYLKKR